MRTYMPAILYSTVPSRWHLEFLHNNIARWYHITYRGSLSKYRCFPPIKMFIPITCFSLINDLLFLCFMPLTFVPKQAAFNFFSSSVTSYSKTNPAIHIQFHHVWFSYRLLPSGGHNYLPLTIGDSSFDLDIDCRSNV